MILYEPERHEALAETPWDAGAARAAIGRIVADTHAAYRGADGLWPIHPLDISPERPEILRPLYYGAAGVIWALRRLEAAGHAAPARDYREAAFALLEPARRDAERLAGAPMRAFLPGEAGILMLQHTLAPSPALEESLAAAIAGHANDATMGLTWGAPGTALAALIMFRATAAPRWREPFLAGANALWEAWTWDEAAGAHVWTQRLYGRVSRQLGALHGFAGNAFVLLKGRDLLPLGRRDELLARVKGAVVATALVRDGLANRPFAAGPSDHPGAAAMRVQHCMGGPGFVNVFAGQLPPDPETDALLAAAGELIWRAGPVAKLPGLCHGVPGSGYAFLKLFGRTGDEAWLERARRFAMHAVAQAERGAAEHGQRKFSLWTGDLGLALFLASCLDGDDAFPTLDAF